MSALRVVLASLSPDIDQDEGLNEFPSYGVRRIQAAANASGLPLELTLLDGRSWNPEELAAKIVAHEPDVLGLSIYVWSAPTLARVAREVKQRRPSCTVVLGGPSARPAVFDLEPFRFAREHIDALVLGEGEECFVDILRLERRDRAALEGVPGLALPNGSDGWHLGAKREPPELSLLPSPYQEGMMPSGRVAYLETFRGCPMSCAFCQWGVLGSTRAFEVEYLARELTAIAASNPTYVYLLDAALNLSARAFHNLMAADAEVGFFARTPLLCEVYPTLLRPEHLEFLARAQHVHVGLGVQSLNDNALAANSRTLKKNNLRTVIEQLSRSGNVDAELILGLPGDSPAEFRRTLEAALTLPCNVRVYRCLVLPDALLTRAPSSYRIEFDPTTLLLRSCHTWSESELAETHAWVSNLALSQRRAHVGHYWWHFANRPGRHERAEAC